MDMGGQTKPGILKKINDKRRMMDYIAMVDICYMYSFLWSQRSVGAVI